MKFTSVLGVFLALAVLGAAWWEYRPAPVVVPVEVPPGHSAWSTYATSTFSISYPSDYVPDTSYAYTVAPGRVSHGVAFMVPPSLTEGTNLASDSFVSVEWIPELSSCHAAQYVMQSSFSGGPTITDDGVEYSFATSTAAAAGNIYDEAVFMRQDPGPCLAVRYFIHSGNIANYPQGSVEEFDKDSLFNEFDQIRRSLKRT